MPREASYTPVIPEGYGLELGGVTVGFLVKEIYGWPSGRQNNIGRRVRITQTSPVPGEGVLEVPYEGPLKDITREGNVVCVHLENRAEPIRLHGDVRIQRYQVAEPDHK